VAKTIVVNAEGQYSIILVVTADTAKYFLVPIETMLLNISVHKLWNDA